MAGKSVVCLVVESVVTIDLRRPGADPQHVRTISH
jgi:hypothetical protein